MTTLATDARPKADAPRVDWTRYAAAYDLMAEHNPAYQALLETFAAAPLDVPAGGRVIDLGGGTGNYSAAAAIRWPASQVLHVDANAAMVARATAKARGLSNWRGTVEPEERFDAAPASADGVICVHALYAFADADASLRRLARWLRPGGWLFAIDLGRPLEVGDWSRWMFRELRRARGTLRAALTFWRGRAAASANRHIARMQRSDAYRLQTSAAFAARVVDAGLTIERAEVVYRGCSDLVIARRPSG